MTSQLPSTCPLRASLALLAAACVLGAMIVRDRCGQAREHDPS